MAKQTNSTLQAIVIAALLILTLPLIYLVVARVILPMEWDEPQFAEEQGEEESQ